jgi:SAM-dependent methyltransferase
VQDVIAVGPSDRRPDRERDRTRRAEYFRLLERHALPAIWNGTIQVLDLGAGDGWLSSRLASFGYWAVAVDRCAGGTDGLDARRRYPGSFAAARADYDALPFASGRFDLAIFAASLHLSPDPAATLAEAKRVLAPGGAIAVMDSPIFEREGLLTFERLERIAATLRLRARFYPVAASPAWHLRHHLARFWLNREPPTDGLWMAR